MTSVLKVVLLGEAGTGKTCLISKFTAGIFNSESISSLSAQFISKTIQVNNKAIKFDIWDTAGQEKYRSLAKIFYKDAKAICLCYDITSKKSFEELKDYWYEQQTKLNVDGEPIFAVVGNKIDLFAQQQVKDEEGKEFAKKINAIFQVTSAKSNVGIDELFENIGMKFLDPNYDPNKTESQEKMEYEQKKMDKKQQKENSQHDQNKGVKLQAGKKHKKKGFC